MEPSRNHLERTLTVTRRYDGPPPSYEACQAEYGDLLSRQPEHSDDDEIGTIIMPIGELLELERPRGSQVTGGGLSRRSQKGDGAPQLASITRYGVSQINAGGWAVMVGVALVMLVVSIG